jgi:hypothetical protein
VRLDDNPFYVLGLSPDASRIEIEREAQKLLGMLELGFGDVARYATPVGARPRTAEAVRAAVAALRDPYRRLVAELFARNAPRPHLGEPAAPASATGDDTAPATATPELLRRALGWRP